MLVTAEPGDRGKRLDSFLQERLPQYSRARLQSWIKADHVQVNGANVRASYLLRGTEKIAVSPAALPSLKAEAEALPIQILYEDDDVVVVDKSAGMAVHPGAGRPSGTLVNALLHHFGTLSTTGGAERPGIVHRIDRETSGVLVIARTDAAHRSLAEQFQSRTVDKIYLALAHGHLRPTQGRIATPIARDPERRTRMTTKDPTGRSALTEYRTLETLPRFSFLEVRLFTGRTHQIRAHFSSLRHPLLGDKLYGAPREVPGLAPLDRFFLHAHRLAFDSPSTGQRIAIESPLPAELSAVLETLRSSADRIDALR